MSSVLPDGVMKVGLHKLENQVEILIIFGADHLVQLHDVRMVQLLQESDLAESSLRVGGVLEGIEDLLERQCLTRFLFGDLPDVTVCPAAHLFEQRVLFEDVSLDLLCHVFSILASFRKLYTSTSLYV
jgi:hypothetical protein